jgi:hypothetical protein
MKIIYCINIQFPPHRKHYVLYIMKTNQLMLFRETFAVYCENEQNQQNVVDGGRSDLLHE